MDHKQRGQSLVEMAIAFPILLLVLAGTLETGWYFNVKLNFLDASREGARIAADASIGAYHANHNHNSSAYDGTEIDCSSEELDIYEVAACMTLGNMYNTFRKTNSGWDDIVISVYQAKNGRVVQVFPSDSNGSWSLTGAQRARITPEYIEQRINQRTDWGDSCPLTVGYVAIEVFYIHEQFLGLMAIDPYIPRYTAGYVYSIFPQNSLGGACN